MRPQDQAARSRIRALYEEGKKLVDRWKAQKQGKVADPCPVLHAHGAEGQALNQVLDSVHQHFGPSSDQVSLGHSHLVFSLTPKQLRVLEVSERYDAIRSLMGVTHRIIEAEVVEVLEEDLPKMHQVQFLRE